MKKIPSRSRPKALPVHKRNGDLWIPAAAPSPEGFFLAKAGNVWQPIVEPPSMDSALHEGYQIVRLDDQGPVGMIRVRSRALRNTIHKISKDRERTLLAWKRKLRVSERRITSITMHFDTRLVVDYIAAPLDLLAPIRVISSGVEVRPSRSVVQHSYERTNTRRPAKILNQLTHWNQSPYTNIHPELGRFSCFFAVDSNMVRHSQGPIVLTSIVQGTYREGSGALALLSHRNLATLVFPAPNQQREQLGWVLALDWLKENGIDYQGATGALVVDAELALLEDFARQRVDVISGFQLPERWNLIYASSDGGAEEFLPNAMMAEADRRNRFLAGPTMKLPFSTLWPGNRKVCVIHPSSEG